VVKIEPKMRCHWIDFSSDGYRLKGMLHLPAAVRPPVVIGSHGLLSSSESAKQRELAVRCTEAGMGYFRFDHRGCGRSQGFFPEVTTLEGRVRDLMAAVQTIRLRTDTGRGCALFGSSMGGAVCLAAARTVGADALVTVAAPIRSRSVRPFDGSGPGESDVTGLQLHFDLSETIAGLRHVLVFHGDADRVVPFAHALEIIEKVEAPKRLVRQENGDHLMSAENHQKTFIREAVNWFASRLGLTIK
jgi:alpha-beta hydrolase superfamily lysophospholipase